MEKRESVPPGIPLTEALPPGFIKHDEESMSGADSKKVLEVDIPDTV